MLGFNEIAQEISEFFDDQLTPERVLLIDCDPDIIKHFEEKKDSNVDPVYADPADPKVWQEYKLVRQKLLFHVWAVTWRQTLNLRVNQKNYP
ncbi:MAG: hypothetical protein Ct9H300mP28_35020 [Pseudomonadota bacterium]|nr:MAG: hypothetical protein Ct9H300mP28_35020 [Pseudomonadota bacterium]